MLSTMNPLKPVRFYGSSLPRPRYYGDGSKERIDPPGSVNDSLLRWAADASWSMGGFSKKRRMQGRIEGRLDKLREESEDDGAVPKTHRKKRASPRKSSPEVVSKTAAAKLEKDIVGDDTAVIRKEKTGRAKGRHGVGVSESPLKTRHAVAHRDLGEWGEEDGPSPSRRVSPRLHVASPIKPVFDSPSMPVTTQPVSDSPARLARTPTVSASVSPVSASVEFPVRRRQVERALPDAEDSDSDVNWDEFMLQKDRPLRRSTRVTGIRRSFKELLNIDSEQDG